MLLSRTSAMDLPFQRMRKLLLNVDFFSIQKSGLEELLFSRRNTASAAVQEALFLTVKSSSLSLSLSPRRMYLPGQILTLIPSLYLSPQLQP
ncbi:unnamed protein product [Calypogeia fissa]